MTPKEMQEKYGYIDLTMKVKLGELELTRMKTIQQLKEQGVIPKTPTQVNPDKNTTEDKKNTAEDKPSELKLPPITPNDTDVHVKNPGVQTQNPPCTDTVPAVPAGEAGSVIHTQTMQSNAIHTQTPQSSSRRQAPTASDSEVIEEHIETPRWLRHDGGELVNTIEMAIRGVQSEETFSPSTTDPYLPSLNPSAIVRIGL
jgi:hypothetical protein